MNLLHLSTYDSGGAGRAVSRLHQGLRSAGINSQMLVQKKASDEATVVSHQRPTLMAKARMSGEFLPTKLYPHRQQTSFSSQWLPERINAQVDRLNPDIVHLHWINHAFVQIETLAKLGRPLVWTLHDMWPFTGGCHYSEACTAYQASCGQCPILHSSRQQDLSSWIWQRKRNAWKSLDISVVAPSQWLGECAKASALFSNAKVSVIPHGLDLETYQPVEKAQARQHLGLSRNKKIVLFGAIAATTDTRKGFPLLAAALQQLSQTAWRDRIELVVFGASELEKGVSLGFPARCLGHLSSDEALAIAYSAADVMIVPSVQEAFGQTAFESLACGTPVVAFEATGLKDIISHRQDGYLALPFDINDLMQGITWILESAERHQTLCAAARDKALQAFDVALQVKRYGALYESLLT